MFFRAESGFRVEKTTVITYYGKKYTTAKGLAMALGDGIAARILWNGGKDYKLREKKYGSAALSNSNINSGGLDRWQGHRRRLRAKAIKRILPILEKLWL
jgi:hypothetical protein